MTILLLLIPACIALFIYHSRHGGGGELGRRIRNSDHWALEDAIAEKKQELQELEKLRAKYPLI